MTVGPCGDDSETVTGVLGVVAEASASASGGGTFLRAYVYGRRFRGGDAGGVGHPP